MSDIKVGDRVRYRDGYKNHVGIARYVGNGEVCVEDPDSGLMVVPAAVLEPIPAEPDYVAIYVGARGPDSDIRRGVYAVIAAYKAAHPPKKSKRYEALEKAVRQWESMGNLEISAILDMEEDGDV